MGEKMLSVTAVASRLVTTSRTIQRWIKEGYFPNAFKGNPDKKSSAYKIPESDVVAFEQKRLNSQKKES